MKLNKNELKWFLILAGFTYYVYNLISTGKIYFFLNPRMIKYIRFSFIVFLILTIFQLKRLFTSTSTGKRKVSFSMFLIPLFLGIYVNPQGLSTEVASKRAVTVVEGSISKNNYAANTQPKVVQKNTQSATQTSSISTGQNKNINSQMKSEKQSNNSSKDNTLIIDGTNFTHITDDICYNSPEKYKGKEVTITGFVYRDDTNSKNEFLVARLMMVCCAADTEVTGLVCNWDKASTEKSNEWVKVTGKIDLETQNIDGEKSIIPVIRVEHVEAAEKPKNQYIYPE